MIKTARQLKDMIRNLSKDKAADAQILILIKKRRLDKLKTAVSIAPQAIQQRFRCDGSASVRLALFNIYLN